ncbi:MAG: ABC transporter permease subunit [Candidatus Sumerlaeaceae bacterium]|nr:ABC transporter permease subunit [Candidatus Sumerlaeaceae bacterium]
MNAPATVVPLRETVRYLGRAFFLEALRRREFYVLLLFMGLYLIGAVVVRTVGVTDAATAAFVLNLGLTLAFFLSHLMTLLLAVRAIPEEIETRTIYPLLAKPVPREHYVLAKWFSAWLTGSFTCGVLLLLGWLPAPHTDALHPATLLQAIVLQLMSLAMLGALGIFLSVFWPKSVNIVILLMLLLAGHRLIVAVGGHLPDTWWGGLVRWMLRYIPDFGILNLIDRYTDGFAPLDVMDFAIRMFYAFVVSGVALAWGSFSFRRRAL